MIYDFMINGFYIPRRDVFLGRDLKYGETGKIKLARLVRQGKGRWERPVHEILKVDGETKTLTSPIFHHSHENLSDFLAKINFYTDINAKYLFSQQVRTSILEIIFYPLGKFMNNYFLKKGFLDGTHGFIHAMMMSFHSFLTRTKLYFLHKARPETDPSAGGQVQGDNY